MNPQEQAYINLDALLVACVSSKAKGKAKGKDGDLDPGPVEFMRKDELTKAIFDRMQNWYEVKAEGKDLIRKYVFRYVYSKHHIT